MKWSSLSNRQRAYALAGARFNRDTIKEGRVVRLGAAKNAKGEALQTLKALDADTRRTHDRATKQSQREALAAFTPSEISRLATRIPAGSAYGAKELNRARAGAMAMGFYKGTGVGC